MGRNKEEWAKYMREYTAKNNSKINARRRELRKQNPDKYREQEKRRHERNPIRNKLWKYGLSREDYFTLVAQQDNKCAICKVDMKVVNIDHCHNSGKVRGLLCTSCNTGIGKLKDDINILQSAIDYLNKHQEE